MMSFNQAIQTKYGVGTKRQVKTLSRLMLKLASARNRTCFLQRCIANNIVPSSFRNRCPIRSKRAYQTNRRYQQALTREALYLARRDIHRNSYKIKQTKDLLKRRLNEEHFNTLSRLTDDSYEKTFQKDK